MIWSQYRWTLFEAFFNKDKKSPSQAFLFIIFQKQAKPLPLFLFQILFPF
jgi:hypothetical protein